MHRLDRDTSGCLLFARNHKAAPNIQQAFEAALVSKSYLAVVDGETPGEEGVIDLPLAKRSTRRARLADGDRGVAARRRSPAGAGSDASTARAWSNSAHRPAAPTRSASMPRAGLGAAIVGDPVYCRADDDEEPNDMVLPDSGLLLHAWRIALPREPKEPIDVTAPVPDRFGRWLDLLP